MNTLLIKLPLFAIFSFALLSSSNVQATKPDSLAFAIGAGIVFPDEITRFNRANLKVHLAGGYQIEPFFVLQQNSQKSKDSQTVGDTTTDTEDKVEGSEVSLGANGNIPLFKRRNAQFYIIASLGYSRTASKRTADDNSTTEALNSALSLGYGVGIEVWISRYLSVCAIGTTPLITRTSVTNKAKREDFKSTDEDVNSAYQLAWDPLFALTFNLWF